MADYKNTTVRQRAEAILDAANHHVYGLHTEGVCEELITNGHVTNMNECAALSEDTLLFMGFPYIEAEAYKEAGKALEPWSMTANYEKKYGKNFLYYFYENGTPINERIKWLKGNALCHEPAFWIFGGGANACNSYYSDENRIDMIGELRWQFALQTVTLQDELPAIYFFKLIASDEHNSEAVRKAAWEAMFRKDKKLIEPLTADGVVQEDFDKAKAVREAYAGHVYGLDTKGVCEELIDDEDVADMDECNYLANVLGLGREGKCTIEERVELLNKFSLDYMFVLCDVDGLGALNNRAAWLSKVIVMKVSFFDPLFDRSNSSYVDANMIDMIHELGQIWKPGAYHDVFQTIADNEHNSKDVKQAAIEELSRTTAK